MLLILTTMVLLKTLEIMAAHGTNIDFNRLKLLTAEHQKYNRHYPAARVKSNNDEAIASQHKVPLKTYQPREDPRLFYQSDAYRKYNTEDKMKHEVAAIYPGRDVVRADDRLSSRFDRRRRRGQNLAMRKAGGGVCVRCPHDRTLVAKEGSDKVLLQSPRLTSCSGLPVPRSVNFTPMYGPAFGSLLGRGSHTIVARITQSNTTLQHCKMQIDVIIQGCQTPNYLKSNCTDRHSKCNFTCGDSRLKLQGESSLLCGEDLKWNGPLPVCKAATTCAPLPPPAQGLVSCQGTTVGNHGAALAEGSRCRIRCPRGWRSTSRAVAAVCRGDITNKESRQKR